MYSNQPTIHPVIAENMRNTRKPVDRFQIVSSDKRGKNPSLVSYSESEPTERRLGLHRRHYTTMIFAMPHEVETGFNTL